MSSRDLPRALIVDRTERKEPQMATGEDRGAPELSDQERVELRQLAELILETALSDVLFEDLIALSAPILEHARDESPEDDGTWSAGSGWASFPTFSAADSVLRELLLSSDELERTAEETDELLTEAARSYGETAEQTTEAQEPGITDAELAEVRDILLDRFERFTPSAEELNATLAGAVPEFLTEAREFGWTDPAAVESTANYFADGIFGSIEHQPIEFVVPAEMDLNEAEEALFLGAMEQLLEQRRSGIEDEIYIESWTTSSFENPEALAIHRQSAQEQLGSPSLDSDLSAEDSSADASDDGEWGLAEIDGEGEPEADDDFTVEEEDSSEDHHGHPGHVHQILGQELRGLDDYEGEPADEREITTLALIAEGIIYAEVSGFLLHDLLAEADPIIRKSRILGPDWWTTEEAAASVADLLSQILLGTPWPASGDGRPHQQKLQRFAQSYPLDPELSRAEKLAALTSSEERYDFLLAERGERMGSELTSTELKMIERLITVQLVRIHFYESPAPKLASHVANLLDDNEIGAGRTLGWDILDDLIDGFLIELLLGIEVYDLSRLDESQLDRLRIELRTYRDSELTEDEFIAHYDQSRWPSVGATVDLSIFTILDGELQVLLIERGNHPEKGKWALPGGFVDIEESLDQAALRELEEETSVDLSTGGYIEQVRTYGYPGRDRRGYIISTLYAALIPDVPAPRAGDDAAVARFFPVSEVLSGSLELAFDHSVLIDDALNRIRAKLEYSAIAFNFLPEDVFTIDELRRVYEIVWGFEILPSDFRRRISQVEGALELGKLTADGANLWSRGSSELFFSPLDRRVVTRA